LPTRTGADVFPVFPLRVPGNAMDGVRFAGIGPGLKLPEVGQPIAVRVAPRTVVAPQGNCIKLKAA
jgi:hypothetical protein